MMTIDEAIAHFRAQDACDLALAWLATQPDVATAWWSCERPDWMLWLAEQNGVARTTLVRVACQCARLALPLVPAGEERPRLAIETTEAWCAGRATQEDVKRTRAGAALAAVDAYNTDNDPARYAAHATAEATYPAIENEIDGTVAAAARYVARAFAAARGDWREREPARWHVNLQMCTIVRRHISLAEVLS